MDNCIHCGSELEIDENGKTIYFCKTCASIIMAMTGTVILEINMTDKEFEDLLGEEDD